MPCMHANLAFINSLMPFMKGLLKRVRLAAGSARGCASRLCLGTPSASDDSDLYYAGSDSSFGTQEKPFQFTWTPNACAPLLHRHGTYVCQRVTS